LRCGCRINIRRVGVVQCGVLYQVVEHMDVESM
jgi:hypothetical protein